MKNDILVSVIITTFSRTNTLERAIKSVINQTYHNLEIIIVDDNKNMKIRDEVRSIIDKLDDKRIISVFNKENIGGALSRNEGIKISNGKYIAFLDDDDEYMPNKISEQLKIFEESKDKKLALVYAYCVEMGSSNGYRKYCNDYTGNCLYEGMVDCIAATSQWMCSKLALEDIGMFSDVPCKQDSTVILKLLIAGYSLDRVDKFLSIYHTDEEIRISSANHSKRIYGEEALRGLCREHYDKLEDNQKWEVEYSFACRLAEHYFALGMKEKLKREMKMIFKYPLRRKSLRVYKHMMEVFGAKLQNLRKK